MTLGVDAEVLDRATNGERAAISEVLDRVLPRVRNVVRYLAGSDEEVDDIAQRALLSVSAGLEGYRSDGAFARWVDRIVARETFSYMKQLRAARRLESEYTEISADTLVDDVRARFLARRALAKWLDALPETHRYAVVLHHVVGMSVPELAEALGIPFDTAKSRLRSGMRKLRALREESEHDRASA